MEVEEQGMRQQHAEALWDALTTGSPCTSHEDIAERMNYEHVGPLLSYVRSPEFIAENGWTVPHQPRGTGEHLYFVLLVDNDRHLTADEEDALRLGAGSTCRQLATMGGNQTEVLRLAAQYVDAPLARLLRNTAKLLDGAAAMAEEAQEKLSVLNGS